MFTKLFKKLSASAKQTQEPHSLRPTEQALIDQIREQSQRDPLVGAKLGAREVLARLLDGLKNEKGVHIESLLCIAGTLAGYACQAQLRAQALKDGRPESTVFNVVSTANGQTYFFGEALNHPLVTAEYSVWRLAGGAAAHAGATAFPDVDDMLKHTASAVGSEHFGIPRLPAQHKAADTPLAYLKAMWPALLPTIKLFCPEPVHWPILYGLMVQQAIVMSKEVIDPALALKIVMESAIPMSKVDLANA